MFRRRLAVLVAAAICGSCSTAVAAEGGKNVVQELVRLFSAWSGDGSDASIFKEAARYIDYNGMAASALGKAQWEKLTARQRQQFVETFRRLVEQKYYQRWHKIFYQGKIQYLGESTTGGESLVKTGLTVGKEESTVYWLMHPRNGELAVIDMRVEDKDLLGRLRARFQRRLAKHGFDNLLAWMKRHADREEDEEDSGASTASRP